ncbi:hypothetical protein [Halolamina salifodinae]|uniref:Uncharacterized protein n=1 Tax=Halolamina salifodinae TaxID=1202767 RepID=A0A8T4GZ61_9EURY|nr:hypothetical protein [Halolamina salifodinae]MBP1988271.1 hypothetical protein [Halolamina salifodinae]
MTDDTPAVYDHYRPRGDDGPVYRVVGVDANRATLLRLTDDEGNREATGDLRYVDRDELDTAFHPADNPDPRFEAPDYLAGLMVLAGVAVAVHPAGDRVSGAILALGGGYLLWRRH